jgi:hypothetical protein
VAIGVGRARTECRKGDAEKAACQRQARSEELARIALLPPFVYLCLIQNYPIRAFNANAIAVLQSDACKCKGFVFCFVETVNLSLVI